jgi:hypothetical protein
MNGSHQTNQITDSVVASITISAPLWLQYVQTYGGFLMMIGGLILLGMRLYLTYRDGFSEKKKDE